MIRYRKRFKVQISLQPLTLHIRALLVIATLQHSSCKRKKRKQDTVKEQSKVNMLHNGMGETFQTKEC